MAQRKRERKEKNQTTKSVIYVMLKLSTCARVAEPSAAHIYKKRSVLHDLDRFFIDQMVGGWKKWAVQKYKIALLKQLLLVNVFAAQGLDFIAFINIGC